MPVYRYTCGFLLRVCEVYDGQFNNWFKSTNLFISRGGKATNTNTPSITSILRGKKMSAGIQDLKKNTCRECSIKIFTKRIHTSRYLASELLTKGSNCFRQMNMVRRQIIKQLSAGMINTKKNLRKAKQGSTSISQTTAKTIDLQVTNLSMVQNRIYMVHRHQTIQKRNPYQLSHSLFLDEEGIIELIQKKNEYVVTAQSV